MTLQQYDGIRQLARDSCGMTFTDDEQPMVALRLQRPVRALGLSSFGEYQEHVRRDTSGIALRDFIDGLATNHTGFLREPEHFAFLREEFGRAPFRGQPIRIWSAACSTGEEPYSVAMALMDERQQEIVPVFQVLATDISTRALTTAKSRIYATKELGDLPPHWLPRFFETGIREWSGWMRVRQTVSDSVSFDRFNLLDHPIGYGTFDLILCRNVLLYFDRATQERVVNLLAARLNPGGYLLIGRTESLMHFSNPLTYRHPAAYQWVP